MEARRRGSRVITVAALALVTIACPRWAQPMSGTVERQLVVGGVTRTYLLHAAGPQAAGPAKPGRALLLMLHGRGGTAAAMEQRTRGTFDKLADRDGAVVVYPQALANPSLWTSWLPGIGRPKPDDIVFLSALIDSLVAELGVDRQHVFAAGFSNGASMVYRLACERPDLVAAVAPISGSMGPEVARACVQNTTPVAIIGMHGTADSTVALDASIRDGIAMWARRNRCAADPISSRLRDADPTDGTETRVDVYDQCAAGTQVAFYTIEGGGHAWPGGEARLTGGTTPRDFDAAELIWAFFQKHARR
jgi:polyhydroxybutyrate depolymerase